MTEEEEFARGHSLIPTEEDERAIAESFRRAFDESEAGVRKVVADILDTPRRDAEFMEALRKGGWPFEPVERAVQPVARLADDDETAV